MVDFTSVQGLNGRPPGPPPPSALLDIAEATFGANDRERAFASFLLFVL
ncbi:hypothetical protein L915_16187, partial [Phytophthora nicotianae]